MSTDWTATARRRRCDARRRGEDIPLRKPGRPRIGQSHLVYYATLPQLLDELSYRISLALPVGLDAPGAVRLTPAQSELMRVAQALEAFAATTDATRH